jgi:hypothetical protein
MIVLLACFPKSGSSFLADILASQPDFATAQFTPCYGRREQEIEAGLVTPWVGRNCVAQHHVRASEYTLYLLDHFRITPLVLVRNLGDTLASLADHIAQEGPETPVAYFNDRISALNAEERLLAVTELAAPWYINFYVSWWKVRPEAIVRYEDVVLGCNFEPLEQRLGMPIIMPPDYRPRRFNVGIQGRGAAVENYLRRFTTYYPDVDFSPIL